MRVYTAMDFSAQWCLCNLRKTACIYMCDFQVSLLLFRQTAGSFFKLTTTPDYNNQSSGLWPYRQCRGAVLASEAFFEAILPNDATLVAAWSMIDSCWRSRKIQSPTDLLSHEMSVATKYFNFKIRRRLKYQCVHYLRRWVTLAKATANACTAEKGYWKSKIYALPSMRPNCITCLPSSSIWKFLADSCVTRPPKSSW